MRQVITDMKELWAYGQILRDPANYGRNYNEILEAFPQSVKDILKTEKVARISPKHISAQLLCEIFMKNAKEIEPEYKADENSKPVIKLLCQYISEDPEFLKAGKGFSFSKGILLRGHTGCGKSTLMRAFNKMLIPFEYTINNGWGKETFHFSFVESWKISEEFTRMGFDLWENTPDPGSSTMPLKSNKLCIDDIGSEAIATHYGNSVNVVGQLLMDRYSKMQSNTKENIITHATSNLSIESLKTFYGDRVFSRMKEMFNDIKYPGDDRRS